ncbi:MAG: FAD-dependent oxidoreductase [Oscillospiraceae bacterium]|nr:FAD-dependent oxidoreductase [Oscillospiraceae bacterium]
MTDFPKTADIVIIGGGGVGTATAYYLAKSGRKNVVRDILLLAADLSEAEGHPDGS